jgi:hypothetical protein
MNLDLQLDWLDDIEDPDPQPDEDEDTIRTQGLPHPWA